MNQIIGLGEDDGSGDETIANLGGDDESTGERQRMTATEERLHFAERGNLFLPLFLQGLKHIILSRSSCISTRTKVNG